MRSTFFVCSMIGHGLWYHFPSQDLNSQRVKIVVLQLCFAFVLCGLGIGRDWRRMSRTIFMLCYALVDSFVFLCRF